MSDKTVHILPYPGPRDAYYTPVQPILPNPGYRGPRSPPPEQRIEVMGTLDDLQGEVAILGTVVDDLTNAQMRLRAEVSLLKDAIRFLNTKRARPDEEEDNAPPPPPAKRAKLSDDAAEDALVEMHEEEKRRHGEFTVASV